MKNMRIERQMTFILVVVLSLLGTSIASAAKAEPVIGVPILIPNNPVALSTITFSVDVTGDDITFVKIICQECNGHTGICHPTQNITMTKVSDITYEQDVALKYSDATYITYWVGVQYGSIWKNNTGVKLNLSIHQPPDDNQTNGSGDNKKTPGFELAVVVAAIAISMILVGRKRYR